MTGQTPFAREACRKPKADPMAKRNPGIPRAKRLSLTVGLVTTGRPDWLIEANETVHLLLRYLCSRPNGTAAGRGLAPHSRPKLV